jgi:hypothetical protein
MRIEPNPEHFGRFLALAENPPGFCCLRCPFGGHFSVSDAQGCKLMLSAMRPNHHI